MAQVVPLRLCIGNSVVFLTAIGYKTATVGFSVCFYIGNHRALKHFMLYNFNIQNVMKCVTLLGEHFTQSFFLIQYHMYYYVRRSHTWCMS